MGCEETYSTSHECRARACAAHCSALAVRLKGRPEGEVFRFCYQCHKFHNLDNFRAPDGSLLELHNCYASQQRRLKRRKLKDALKGRTRSKLKGRAASVGAAAQAAEPVVGNPFLRTTLCASALEHPFAGKSGEKNAVSLPAAPLPDVNAAHAAAQMVPSNNLHAGGRGGMLLPGIPVDYLPGSSLATSFSLEPPHAASDLLLSLESYLGGDV